MSPKCAVPELQCGAQYWLLQPDVWIDDWIMNLRSDELMGSRLAGRTDGKTDRLTVGWSVGRTD